MTSAKQSMVTVVDKVLPFGVFVKLNDGRRGYIRRREMSWEGDLDPRELVRPGQDLEAIPLEPDPSGETIVLSHRALLPDPWIEFARTHDTGESITGSVKRLGADIVWVEIQPGVQGSIALDELSATPVERAEDVVWPGDDVAAVITHLDPERRLLRLSMRRRLAQMALVTRVMKNITAPTASDAAEASAPPHSAPESVEEVILKSSEIARIGSVLVVEDRDDLRQSLVKWLADRGLHVSGVAGCGDASAALDGARWGLCLVDIGLSGEDGLLLIRKAQRTDNAPCMAVMSTPELLDKRWIEISTLEIGAAFAKPLDLSELGALLLALGQGRCPQLASEERDSPTQPAVFLHLDTDDSPAATLQGQLQQTLNTALEMVQAEHAILFEMTMPHKAITIVAEAGRLPVNRETLYLLPHSPVKDVISEREPVVTDRVSAEPTRRFEKLEPLLPFESCLGMPITTGAGVKHALFCFHRKPKVFNIYRQRDAWAMATLLAAHLERQAFDEQLRINGDLLLSGRLASAFGHEIHNKMSTVELQGVNLRHDLEQMVADGQDDPVALDALRAELDALIHSTLQLKGTVRRFQDLMRAEEHWRLDLNGVARSVESQLRAVLQEQQVTLRLNLAPELPSVPGNAQRVHYVLLNLMLNAIQQMDSKMPKERHLEVSTSYEPKQGRRPVRARITDSGPGIHKQLWEQIFQLGFSTRPNGTGLGLYIARSLVENMGGRLSIERSVISIGTTFLLTFPEAMREERDGSRTD